MLRIFNNIYLIKLTSIFYLIIICILSYGQDNYFQQQVNTTIEVELDDSNHFLYAKEKIVYINNSPFEIDSIFFHLWPNAYKNVDTELAKQKLEDGDVDLKYAYKSERGYIDSLDFHVNGEKVHWTFFNDIIDIAVLSLNKTLKPNDSIIIETPFRVKIPSGRFSRLGHIGQSYQITQWFPKPAVFDNDGWHPMSYLDQGEFYSEYGNYDVSITVPENYVLMATGDLQNKQEIDFLNQKAKETQILINDNKLPIRDSSGKRDLSFPKSSKRTKTLRFVQKNVHDFGWFADKRYHVLKGSVKLPKSQKEVTSWALFTNNEAELWEKSIEYINDATLYFSKWVGEYPYNHVTAVDGTISAGGGMEYPNITVIGSSGNSRSLETVIIHEVGHNWYYGILGNNERDNAWMDEGLNTYIEIRYFQEKYKNKSPKTNNSDTPKEHGLSFEINLDQSSINRIGYQFNASRNYDQPLQMGSEFFTSFNYGGMVYMKTGIGFHYLKTYLGDELFDSAMNKYFEKWKFRHPKPKDIKDEFEKVCKKDLSWFFDGFINTNNKTDYCIKKVKKLNDNEYAISLKNQTGYNSPIPIQAIKTYNDSIKIIDKKWVDGFIKDTSIVFKTTGTPSHFLLDQNLETTDFNYYHHLSKSKGIFKLTKPVKLKLLPIDINNNQVNHIYWAPLLGWNAYDRLMPGLALYNKGIKTKKTEWILSPLYSLENKVLNGIGEISHYHNTNNFINRIEYGYKTRSFSYREGIDSIINNRWMKHEVYTNLRLNENKLRYSPSQNILVRAIRIDEGFEDYDDTTVLKTIYSNYYGQVKYTIKNKQVLKPKSLELKYNYGFNFENNIPLISSLELTGDYKHNYNDNLDDISIRFFAGYNFITNNSRYNLNLTGQDGFNDYLYDRTYFVRNNYYQNSLSRQTSITQGAFKLNSGLGGSDSWLLATNLSAKVPRLPFRFFMDIGVFPSITVKVKADNSIEKINEKNILYAGGLSFDIKSNDKTILGVYIPLIYSNEFGKSSERGTNTGTNKTIDDLPLIQKITFVFNLNEINPFTIKKNIRP